MSGKPRLPGSFRNGCIPTRLNNVNLIPQHFESDEEYFLPNNYQLKRHDVLCGQSKTPGNERFRIIAEMRVQRYLAASCRREKVQIVTEMVDAVRQAGGNFVRPVPGEDPDGELCDQRWMDIGNVKAREKASHALRCCASKYQKSKTEPPDASESKTKRNEGPSSSSCPEPPQKKMRVVSGGFSQSTRQSIPIVAKDDVGTFQQNTIPALTLNDLILFHNAGGGSKKTMFHDLRCDIEEDGYDSMLRSLVSRPTVEASLTSSSSSHMITPATNNRCLELNTGLPRDLLIAQGETFRKLSLLEANCGLIINDEDLLDLFDFKETLV